MMQTLALIDVAQHMLHLQAFCYLRFTISLFEDCTLTHILQAQHLHGEVIKKEKDNYLQAQNTNQGITPKEKKTR